MIPELSEIKTKRKELHLTQEELSEKSSVPQSVIAKIESGKVIPSYENAKKIFDALSPELKKKQTVKSIMRKNVVSVSWKDKVSEAINLMNKHGISQLPVMKKNIPVGTVTEKNLVEKIDSGTINSSDEVKKVMEGCLPIIEGTSGIEVAASLLKYCPAALIKEKDKITGIVTRTNIIRKAIPAKS